MVRRVCSNSTMLGSASSKIAHKFKILKNAIRNWTKEVGLKDERDSTNIMEELTNLENFEGSLGLSSEYKDIL